VKQCLKQVTTSESIMSKRRRSEIFVRTGRNKNRRTVRSARALTIPRDGTILAIPSSGARPNLSSFRQRNMRTGGFLGIEKKFVDYEYGPTAISATWAGAESDPTTALCLNVTAQGDGQNQHEGRAYKLNRLQIRGRVHRDPSSDQVDFPDAWGVRLIVVWDRQTNGAQLNAEDVMVDETAATQAPYHFRNLQYAKRFKVLKDWNMDLGGAPGGTDGTNTNSIGGLSRTFKLNIPLSITVNSTGTTAAIASVQDNSIHVIACATVTGLELQYTSRVRFFG